MRLSEAQQQFTICIGKLIAHATKAGYGLTFGDAYRDPRVFGMVGERKSYSHPTSTHKRRLAVDWNLFKDGRYMDRADDYRELGEWWEALGEREGLPLCWGGRFRDAGHFSMEWDGTK